MGPLTTSGPKRGSLDHFRTSGKVPQPLPDLREGPLTTSGPKGGPPTTTGPPGGSPDHFRTF